MKSLRNKVIVLTGSNGLLGRIISEYLNSWGAVVVGADISQHLEDRHNRKVDASNQDQLAELISFVNKEFGTIDGWVNNAYPRTADWGNKVEDINMDSWRLNV